MEEDARLGATALYMAAGRAEESSRQDALFSDPSAAAFAGDDGRAFISAVAGGTGLDVRALSGAVAARTRFFDDALASALAGGTVAQVVSLAVGGDTRSTRLGLQGVVFYEVDLPCVMARRAEVLPACAFARPVAFDLRESSHLRTALVGAGFDPELPSVWLAEGLLMYVPADAVAALLREVGAMSAPGSVFLGDFLNNKYMDPQVTEVLMKVWSKYGAMPCFTCDAPERLLEQHAGFAASKVVSLGEAECNFGRLPEYPPVPRQLVDDQMPRNLLVVARKK